MPKQILKIITYVYLISFGLADIVVAHPKTQILSHDPTSLQFINFQYKDPIDGINVHGRFIPYRDDYLDPPVVPYYGRYEGSAEVTLTRLSDMKSTTREFREVSFVLTDHCLNFDEYDYQNPVDECTLEDPLILEPDGMSYTETTYVESLEGRTTVIKGDEIISKFLPEVGIKIIDYDYDNNNELILITPMGYRGGPEFFVYEIINNKEEFRIGYDFPDRIPRNVEFDYVNKTMNYSYSSGAYDTLFYSYAADASDGYKLASIKHTCDLIDFTEYDTEQRKILEDWCVINSN